MNANIICIISGPTASGKTRTSLDLAKLIGAEIVNFDSLLFYKELNIGTAKPTVEELLQVPHHMINTHSLKKPINAADYLKLAGPIIEKLHQQGKIVFLVGGSGFYLQALLYGMYESETTPPEILRQSGELYNKDGISPFLKILQENDPASFARYHANDHYRIRRAVEHFWTTGKPLFEAREQMATQKHQGPMYYHQWQVHHIHLDLPKQQHLAIIHDRTLQMLKDGLIKEVEHILRSGFTGDEKPLKSIGYKETIDFLQGNIPTQDQLISKIDIATRQLAKSQRTWFKKVEKLVYNPLTDQEKIRQDLLNFLKKNNRNI
jgi:tRNA dimethylallyltransferase